MKKLFTQLGLLLCFTLFMGLTAQKAEASHMMGSDIQWKCLGNDSFRVTIRVYRDCNGIAFQATSINVSSSCGSLTAGASISEPVDITPVCKKQCTRCDKGAGCDFPYGIHVYTITAIVSLSDPRFKNCCEFDLTFSQCCRNGAITNITPGDFFIASRLNRCVKPCDNSPYFTNPPVAIVCKGQCITFNPGVNDDDVDFNGQADSLVYKLVTPRENASSTVSYNSPYSTIEPLPYDGLGDPTTFEWDPPKTCKGFRLDPETGDLQFKPTKAPFSGVLAYEVQEWRKDSAGIPRQIGVIRRDLQIIIVECPDNRAPTISGIDGTSRNRMDFCAGEAKCFTVNSFDFDKDDTVTMTWNKGIPDATFEIETGKQFPRGRFCWAPKKNQVRTYPYSFIVNGMDDACPVNSRTSRAFQIFVNPAPEATRSIVVGNCGLVTFKAFTTGKVPITQYRWGGDDRFRAFGPAATHFYTKPGTYYVDLTVRSDRGCETIYSDSVVIAPYVTIDLPRDTSVCTNTTFTSGTVRSLGASPYLYYWGADGRSQNDKTKWSTSDFSRTNTFKYRGGTGSVKTPLGYEYRDTLLWAWIWDQNGNGCKNVDSQRVRVYNPPLVNLGPDRRGCFGQPFLLNADSFIKRPNVKKAGASTGLKYKWISLATGAVVSTLKSFNVKDSGKYILQVDDSLTCGARDTIQIFFNPEVDVQRNTVRACLGDRLILTGGRSNPTAVWKWVNQVTGATVATTRDYIIPKISVNPGPKAMQFQVSVTQTINGVTCKDLDTIIVDVKDTGKITLSPIRPICINIQPFSLSPYANPQGGVWTIPGKPSAIQNNMLNPQNAGLGVFPLLYTYTDPERGCVSRATTKVQIDKTPNVFAGNDTFLCQQNGIMTLNGFPATGFWTGIGVKRTSNGDYIFDPNVSGFSAAGTSFQLIYRYDNNTGAKCGSEDTVQIVVYRPLKVTTGSYGPVCNNDAPVNLKGSGGGDIETWSGGPAGAVILNGTQWQFDPNKVTPGDYTLTYTVSYTGNRCPVKDSTIITVKPFPIVSLKIKTGDSVFCRTQGLVELVYTSNPAGGVGTITSSAPGTIVSNKYFDTRIAPLGSSKLSIRYSDPNGCASVSSINIIVQDTASVAIATAPVFCDGDRIIITGTSTNTAFVRWSVTGDDTLGQIVSPNSLVTEFIPAPSQIRAGKFRLRLVGTAASSKCATASVEREFLLAPVPVANFTQKPTNGCGPLTVSFNNTSTVTRGSIDKLLWSFGDGQTSIEQAPVHTYTAAGIYTVSLEVTTLAGCKDTLIKPRLIEVFQSPTADFRADPTFTTISLPTIKFESTSRDVYDGTKYFWNFGDIYSIGGGTSTSRNPEYTYRDTGYYTVQLVVVNPNGCRDTLIRINYVRVAPEITVFIPNAFSPNNLYRRNSTAVKNERFKVIATEFATFEMDIYNRWGQLLYHSTDIEDGWNGQYNSLDVQEGVYIYSVRVTSLAGKTYKYSGNITLLR